MNKSFKVNDRILMQNFVMQAFFPLLLCLIFTFPLKADSASEFSKVFSTDTALGDKFGNSVAVHGNIMVVGSPHEDSGGNDLGALISISFLVTTGFFKQN